MKKTSLKPSFTLEEIKNIAFDRTKAYWKDFVVIGILALAVFLPLEAINTYIRLATDEPLAAVPLMIVSFIIQMIFSIGIVRYSLAASDNKKLAFKKYFTCNTKMILFMAATTILYAAIVALGFIALIVPGIIFAYAFSFYIFPIVEKNMGGFDALKESWHLTKGNRGRIFLFDILLALATFVVIAIPMFVAMAPAFLRIEGAGIMIAVLGTLAVIWAVVAGIFVGALGTIATAVMYRKMQVTRKVTL